MSAEVEARPTAFLERVEAQEAVERSLWIHMFKAIAVAIPVCIVIWVAITALALSLADGDWDWWVVMVMAVAVGIFGGLFFGGWAAFVAKAHTLDEADRHR